MRLETYFEKFDLFADAPNGVAKMRELVLQLAVRGNLTEQGADESSQAQLALAEEFRIGRGRRDEPDSEDIPFDIPGNWGWVAVGDSMYMINGRAFKPEEWTTEGTPIIRIQNLNNAAAPFNYCKLELDPKIHVHNDDFLISWSGTPGTSFGAFIWNRGFAYLNQHIFRCELVGGIFQKEFLRLAVNARLDEMISHAQGAVGLRHITKGKLEGIRLPLPPLAEQQRIVAKVDELMALCDRLEAQQQECTTRHAALARASLTRFAEAPTPANLDFLFHQSYPITPADLRKAILSLAVQGKVVPQDPNGDSAANLLVHIVEEQGRMVRERLIRRQETSQVAEDEAPFDIPDRWVWTRLGQIGDWGSGSTPARGSHELYGGGITWLKSGELNDNRQLKLSEETVTDLALEAGSFRRNQVGDVLIAMYGATIGKLAILAEPAVTNQAVCGCTPFPGVLNTYLFVYLHSQREQFHLASEGGAQPNISKVKIVGYPFPLPPLAEQRRIVAKVDQLMALVAELETQLAVSRATAEKLMEAAVAELTTEV